jgi:hypothetical protein
MTPDPDRLAALRREVGLFRDKERRRRRFDPVLHVGALGGERASVGLPASAQLDRQLRLELVSALVEVSPGRDGWVSRPGLVEPTDDDVAWLVAAAAAFGEAGRELDGFYVLTREGWLDVRTGERRVWKRLRLNR